MGLTAAPILSIWLIGALAAGGLAATLLQHRVIARRLGSRKAVALSVLRLSALWLAVFFALNPSLVKEREQDIAPTVAVLIDASLTMGLPGRPGGTTRLDEARELLAGGSSPLLSTLARTYDVQLYALDGSLRRIEAGNLRDLKATGRKGDLSGALKALSGKASCALLLSDGALIEQSQTPFPRTLPVITIPTADPAGYKDVMIESVHFPQVTFKGREATIDVSIKSHGYKDVTVPVVLKEGGKLLTARNVRLGVIPPQTVVSFPFAPVEVGTRNLTVTVQPQVGESLTENNSADFSLEVVRDKVRILMVSGSPSLNYRFMRLALKNDPSVDLLSFVILRTPSNVIDVPLNEQSLIPFPVDTLFSQELKEFDLVIFDNLPFHLYISGKHLRAVRDFVRDGGALAMIGGPRFSDDKQLSSNALADVLPVECEESDYRRGGNASLRLTPAGVVHPLTRLSPEKEYNGLLWKEMAAPDGINLLKPKGSATVLLEAGGVPAHPLLTVGGYGKGRVLVLGTDYAWKWSAGMVARGRDNWAYLRLMERMVRWLTKDPSLDQMTLILPENSSEAGGEVQMKLRVSEEPSGRVEPPLFSVFGPDGVRLASRLKPGGLPGEFLASFTPPKRGAYRMRAETRAGTLEETMVVGTAMDRLDGNPNPETLNTIAAQTGGKVVSDSAALLKEIAAYAGKEKRSFTEKREIPLWSNYYAVAVILALLSVEWFLRRRWGLP
jgi:uncharacterized membrane protein